MDPVSLVVGALAAGAAEGVGDAAKATVGDLYERLKTAVKARFAGHSAAEVALAEHEGDPDVWSRPLAKQLSITGAAAAPEVIVLAEELMGLVDPVGAGAGKYRIDASGAKGVQVGDGNTMNNTFGS